MSEFVFKVKPGAILARDYRFTEDIDPYVREKFLDLQSSVRSNDLNQEQE